MFYCSDDDDDDNTCLDIKLMRNASNTHFSTHSL